MGMRRAPPARIDARRAGHLATGRPASAARPASATSPRTGTGTGCCSTRRSGRTASSATRPGRPTSTRRPDRPARGPQATPSGSSRSTTSARPGSTSLARALSGGNQQKLIVGREMSGDPILLIAAHPTRGVDVGAQAAIWDHIKAARREGLAVLLISADLDELIGLSDTIQVILRGRLVGTFDPDDVTPEELGSAMTGAGGEAVTPPRRPAARCSPSAAPVLALLAAFVITSLVLLVAGDPVRRRCGASCCPGPRPRNVGQHHQQRHRLYLSGDRGGHRLPDEPVQHRRRRPVPRGRVRGRRRRRRGLAARATSTPSLALVVAMAGRRAVGRHRRPAARSTRGVSEVISTIMLNAIATCLVAYLLAQGRGARGGQQRDQHQADPRGQPDPGHPADRGRPTEIYGFIVLAVLVGFALLVRAQQDPVRLRPARHRPVRDGGRRQRHQRQADGDHRDAALRRRRRPGRHAAPVRRRLHLRHRRSSPGSASPASRSRCSAATTRSASRSARCCSPTSTSSPTRCRSWSASRRTSW